MFGKKNNVSVEIISDISTRFANLFISSYSDRNLSSMHAIIVCLLHTSAALAEDEGMQTIMIGNFKAIISQSNVPKDEIPMIDCLIRHYL